MSQAKDNTALDEFTCPVPIRPTANIVLGHGSGGRLSHDLITQVILPELGEAAPRDLDDSAALAVGQVTLALTTDSHVVSPLFFPGGDIGRWQSAAPSTIWPWLGRLRSRSRPVSCWKRGSNWRS